MGGISIFAKNIPSQLRTISASCEEVIAKGDTQLEQKSLKELLAD